MIGKVCSEVSTKTIDNGKLVGNFRLETHDGHKQYHTINCYDKTAHEAKDFVGGQMVFVEGKVNTRSYMDKNNQKKYVTTINASRVAHLGEKINEEDSKQIIDDLDEDVPF